MISGQDIASAVRHLAAGGVVAAATETLFGFLADATRPDAIDRVVELKQRDATKAIALLLPDRAAWDRVAAAVPAIAARLADRFWPGPLTLAVDARSGLDARLVTDGTVAARWPAESDASAITAAWGGVLTATSANGSGEPPCMNDGEVRSRFADAVRAGWLWVVSGHAGCTRPSTVVRVTDSALRLIRAGAISREAMETALDGIPFVVEAA